MECLDESTVLALVGGELEAGDAAARRRHLAECDACRALVAAVAGADDLAMSPGGETNTGTAFATTEGVDTERDDVVDHLRDETFMERLSTGAVLDGRYRIERVLGAGGMGVVALATHVALGQKVAIKLLHPRSLASAEVVARFVREAKAAVRVASDHVVRVLDVASLPTGEPYIAMEYLVGRDVRAHLAEKKRLSVLEVVDVVAQACLGVGRAHRAGIVHRDLKPANLFVLDAEERDPEAPFLVKVLDFGVSKVRRDEASADEASLTRSTAFLGTPLYMSPEQVKASRDVDARADVWALGCILHELLTGKAPFRRASLGLTCAAILLEDAGPVSRARSDVPRGLEAIVARCLEKERDARFADGFDLAVALAPFASSATREEIARVVGASARPTAAPRSRTRALALFAAAPIVAVAAFLGLRSAKSTAPAPPVLREEAPSVASSNAPAAPSSTTVESAPSATSAATSSIVTTSKPAATKLVAPTTNAAPSASSAPSVPVVPASASAPAAVASPSAPLNPEFGPRK